MQILNQNLVKTLLLPRPAASHKGTFGHALIVAGSSGMAGAAVLSAQACLRSGAGLASVYSPQCNRVIVQTAVPEAIFISDTDNDCISKIGLTKNYDAVAVGCGIGTDEKTVAALHNFLNVAEKPLVLDADALNIIAKEKSLLEIIPPNSIITPHPKEFERLTDNKITADEMAAKYKIVVVLKGSKTQICAPDGKTYFNITENSGLATAGSGDVLTGIIASLLAQHYKPLDAALIGVYLHSTAGKFALAKQSEESMIASDIIENLGKAFREFKIDKL